MVVGKKVIIECQWHNRTRAFGVEGEQEWTKDRALGDAFREAIGCLKCATPRDLEGTSSEVE